VGCGESGSAWLEGFCGGESVGKAIVREVWVFGE